MTSRAEGEQQAHPDSPEGKRQEAEEMEVYRADRVALHREVAHENITAIRARIVALERAVGMLDDAPGALYDVEYADGGGPAVVAQSIALIRVGLAAIESVIPEPGS